MTISRTIFQVSMVLGLTACTTMGTGEGSTREGRVHAVLSWLATGARSGMMTAMLSTGETYNGTSFQITSDTRVDGLGPLRVGWGRPWPGWPYWGIADSGPQFITHYSGRMLANLDEGPNGAHMRCSFRLIRPAAGIAGGGQGQCQLPSGEAIDATFPPA